MSNLANSSNTSTAIQTESQINEQLVGTSRVVDVDLDNPGFGSIFSDHMISIRYENERWQKPAIVPFEDVKISPATAALHYSQTVFEGLKAFQTTDGEIKMFRPEKHMQRLVKSCNRMCIPAPDIDLLMDALERLITIDKQWVPDKQGNALYIRPLIFATDPFLGVQPSKEYQLLIMTSPVGAYYKEGINPVTLTTSSDYVRAVQGGAGYIKTSCNYGPTLLPAKKAKEQGYTQILWLDAKENSYIEEVGTMNIFFKFDDYLVTPPLEGSILGGITRDSVITLAYEWGIEVKEARLHIDDLFDAYEDGSLKEVFGSGTAAVISPVGQIDHEGDSIVLDKEKPGPLTQRLYDAITGIQYGKKEDPFGWMHKV